MNRRHAVPGTPLSRPSLPEKPYLYRGQPGLIELNARARADRAANPNAYATDGQIRTWTWPMPLPGPVHPAGNWKPKEAPGDGERTQVA